MQKKTIPLILFIAILFPTFLSALLTKEIFQAAFVQKEIGSDEKIAVHPDGQSIIYTVHQKPSEGFPEDVLVLGNGVPSNRFYSTLCLHELRSGKIVQIGPKNANCFRPCFSPDGEKVAFYCDEGGFTRLWVYEITSEDANIVCDEKVFTHPLALVDRPYWSSDNKIIYFPALSMETSEGFPEKQKNDANVVLYSSDSSPPHLNIPLYSKIISVTLASGKSQPLCPYQENDPLSSMFVPSKTGNSIAYFTFTPDPSSPSFELRVFSTSDPKKIFTIATQIHIESGKTQEIAWHPHQEKIAFIEKNKVFIASLDDGEEINVEELSKDKEAIFSAIPLNFSRDGKTLLVGAHLTNYGCAKVPKSLFLFSLEGAPPCQVSIPDEWQFLSLLETEEGAFWEPCPKTLTAHVKNGTESAIIRFFLEEGNQHHEILWRGASLIKEVVASQKTNQVFYVEESLNIPQNVYQASCNFSNKTRLSCIDPKQDFFSEVKVAIFETTVPRYDGSLETVETAIFFPKTTHLNQPSPAIVHVYPGSIIQAKMNHYAGGDTASFPTRLLLEQGYAVVCPDLQISPPGKRCNPLQESVDRLLPQLYHAANLGLVDINRLGLIGQSYGGYGTAAITSKTTLFRASVCISGLYDLIGGYGSFSKNKGWEGVADTAYFEKRQGRMGTHPWDDIFNYIKNSPYYLANDINNPLLLIHGENDTTSPIEEAQKMFTALKRLGKKVDLAIYKNEGHVIRNWKHANAFDAVNRVIDFFDLHLSTP
ncbi:Uncharacterized protein PHSC3_000529 [Chlamydiales bacterium STE3]|nr:Uncharacterized protein PHSC3_000529 [Chlamydiales bacterium STE3]